MNRKFLERAGLAGMLIGASVGMNGCSGDLGFVERRPGDVISKPDGSTYVHGESDDGALGLALLGGIVEGLGVQKGNYGAAAFGNAISRQGNSMASAGRTNVNVYNQIPQQNANGELSANRNNRSNELILFAFNYHMDLNGDGGASPEEFIGLNNTFGQEERVTFGARLSGRKGQMIEVVVYDSAREIVKSRTMVNNTFDGQYYYPAALEFNPGELRPGNYLAIINAEGKPFGHVSIEVTK